MNYNDQPEKRSRDQVIAGRDFKRAHESFILSRHPNVAYTLHFNSGGMPHEIVVSVRLRTYCD